MDDIGIETQQRGIISGLPRRSPLFKGRGGETLHRCEQRMFPILTSRSPLFDGPRGETLHRCEKSSFPTLTS